LNSGRITCIMHVVLKVFHIPRSTYYDWLRCND
jgi:hypothetical protein